MTTIAIMQPYFVPYAGYFRLFAATDIFVIYDCVQFLRRGWMHRNKLTLLSGERDWLTLPLEHAARDIKIKDLQFAPDATERFHKETKRFSVFQNAKLSGHPLIKSVMQTEGLPIDFLISTLKVCCETLNVPFNIIRSSTLPIPEDLHGQDRILAICKHLGATDYVNAPGGRELYSESAFSDAGIKLRFLPDYQGNFVSILERILLEDNTALRNEIMHQL